MTDIIMGFPPLILFVLGAVILYYGAEYLIESSVLIAKLLGVSGIVIGITVVAFGTSLPELIISLTATDTGIIVGNIIGSNIANMGLVLGISAIITPIVFQYSIIKIDYIVLNIVTIIFAGFLFYKVISVMMGLLFLVILMGYIVFLFMTTTQSDNRKEESFSFKIIIYFILGVFGLKIGSDWFLNGAIAFAEQVGISSSQMGISGIALGTSLPELAASSIAAIKKRPEIAIGNVIGSNLFNILMVIGSVFTFKTILPINDNELLQSSIVMVLITLFTGFIIKYKKGIPRIYGIILLVIYFSMIILTLA
jgi:cation:H+ antiporter